MTEMNWKEYFEKAKRLADKINDYVSDNKEIGLQLVCDVAELTGYISGGKFMADRFVNLPTVPAIEISKLKEIIYDEINSSIGESHYGTEEDNFRIETLERLLKRIEEEMGK